MPKQPIKIFEITSKDWLKGMSRQTTSMMGGMFKIATAYDPFEQPGYCLPATSPTAVSGADASVNFLTPFSTGGTGFFFAHGSTKLYKVNALASTLTDETASITTGTVRGATVWKDRYLYALDTSVRSITLGLASDTEILASLTTSVPHIMCTGADLNCYVTNGSSIGKLILSTGTTGNSTSAFSLETGQVARDLVNDGRYLVIISDNNSSLATTARGKCLVTFWDMAKGTADEIFEIDDTYLIGAKVINGTIYIIGYDNIYACTAGSPPQVVYTFLGSASVTGRPTGPAAIAARNGCLLWADGSGATVHGLGNPFNPKQPVLFTPFTNNSGNGQALVVTG